MAENMSVPLDTAGSAEAMLVCATLLTSCGHADRTDSLPG
jgi:hypothetical protein